jgi:hypothetical protein
LRKTTRDEWSFEYVKGIQRGFDISGGLGFSMSFESRVTRESLFYMESTDIYQEYENCISGE